MTPAPANSLISPESLKNLQGRHRERLASRTKIVHLETDQYRLITGDALTELRKLPDESVHCVVTSPPYWGLRDYQTGEWIDGDPKCDHRSGKGSQGPNSKNPNAEYPAFSAHRGGDPDRCAKCGAYRVDQQLGLERTPDEYVVRLVEIFTEVRRVLRKDGTCWLNLGDSYASDAGNCRNPGGGENSVGNSRKDHGAHPLERPTTKMLRSMNLKPKELVGIPWMVAFALRADGWWLRSDIIWHKPSTMPESVQDRPTKAHEYIFLLTRSRDYFYDGFAVREDSVCDHGNGQQTRKFRGDYGGTGDGVHRGFAVPWECEADRQRGLAQGVLVPHGDRDPSANGAQSRHGKTLEAIAPRGKRNRRTVWSVGSAGYPEAHFATFPPDLIRPCILAGTSEYGCCSTCGAPWQRILKKSSKPNAPSCNGKYDGKGKHRTVSGGVSNDAREEYHGGWKPTCRCIQTERAPCVVLDPFAGTFTAGMVAMEYGRRAIGIELNPDYADMARRRVAETALQERLELHELHVG